jgi:hypothetical protein
MAAAGGVSGPVVSTKTSGGREEEAKPIKRAPPPKIDIDRE